jgi:flagellum-specific peptidoglycan hydrolase FlgJ
MKYLILLTALIFISAYRPLATPANTRHGAKIPTHVTKYIKRFLPTAKNEADRFNIPVSIKLAQGILESNAGRSELSRRHNNHFGIKYRGTGKYAVYRDDSPRDRFQVFKSAWYSYRAHSKLLTSDRYKHLTKLNRLQYKKWAYGLKKAGYATAPKYAESLIAVIEKYQLWKYDVKFFN